MLSWQNVLNSRQISVDIEEKLVNQGEVLCGGISRIYLSLSNKWKPSYGVINSRPRNVGTALLKYFWFQGNCKETTGWSKEQQSKLLGLFPNFLWNYIYNFENVFTAWSEEVQVKVTVEKNRVLQFFPQNFWLGCLSTFKTWKWVLVTNF